MKYEEFKTNLIEELKDFYGADATVELTTATKNNGIHLDGIIIRLGETNVAPIIYLQQYYEEFMENENSSIDEIVGRIVELRERHELQDADGVICKITDWTYVKEHVYPMLISTEDNKEMLSSLVTKPFLDLSVIFYIRLEDTLQMGGEATVKVTKEMLSLMKVTEIELFDAAMNNMKSDGYNVQDIFSVIMGITDETIPDDENCEKMFVMTNADKRYGAAGLLNITSIVEKIGDKSCFLLPSSLHEILVVPENDEIDVQILKTMVVEVNTTSVAEEEKLSDSVYYYSSTSGTITIAA